ncbi:MAG TPA: vWA domain-containing protein, partial [Pirellulales bacterium]
MIGISHVSRRFRQRLRDPRRRGVIIILAAFLIQTMFAFAAFAIDLGYIVLTSQQLQNAADAAALASVLELKSADPNMSAATIRQNAVNEAIYAASLNRAALRSVQIDQRDILFGNRHFDESAEKWVNTYENEPGFGSLPINSVDVRISFDSDAGAPLNSGAPSGGWAPRSGRERLPLFFGRVIQVNDTVVSGDSRAHLTPRDLAFVLDISGSMASDSVNSDGYTPKTEAINSMFPFYNGNLPSEVNYRAYGPAGGKPAVLPTPVTPPTVAVGSNGRTNTRGPVVYPYLPDSSLDATRDLWYKWLWERSVSDGVWGNSSRATQFAEQEFGDAPTLLTVRQYWLHWKWQAYCDYAWCNSSTVGGLYNGISVSLSTPSTPQRWDLITNPNNESTRTVTLRNRNVFIVSSAQQQRMSVTRYTQFLFDNGMISPIRGQIWAPRDKENDKTVDASFPPAGYNNPLHPYPNFSGYYPKPLELTNYDSSKLYMGGSFTAVYGGTGSGRMESLVKPNCFVRQATMFGIEAMISDENAGNDAYDQVGMITYGSVAWRDLELTNDLATALKIANCRIAFAAPSSNNMVPPPNGATNIGMGIRQGIQMLKYSSRSRSYTNKTMALLTDGKATAGPSTSNTNNEIKNGVATVKFSSESGFLPGYVNYWADQAKDEEIVIHTIVVGNDSDPNLLESIAT